MREVPIEANRHAADFLEKLEAGRVDVTILLTGVGLRALLAALPADGSERFRTAARRTKLVARGPKPVGVLRELGLSADYTAPEPNTWRELLDLIDAGVPVEGRTVAVQEYGVENEELTQGLRDRGADVIAVPVYRWALPVDLAPLQGAITTIAEARADAVLFTSATQLHHLWQVAGERAPTLVTGLSMATVASIGPICTEALAAKGIGVDFEPGHPKMGHLVRGLARWFEAADIGSVGSESKDT